MMPSVDFDFDKAVLEFGLPSEMMTNINRGPQHTCGLEYRIIPLDSPSIRKQTNDKKVAKAGEKEDDGFHIGRCIYGHAVKNNKKCFGPIVNYVWDEMDADAVKYFIIQDRDTNQRVEVFAHSAHLIDEVEDNNNFDDIYDNQVRKMELQWKKETKDAKLEQRWKRMFNESKNLEENSKSVWRPQADDELYRDAFLNEYWMPDKFIRYYDDKFAGKYRDNKIEVNRIAVPQMFRRLMGAVEFDTFGIGKLAKKFMQIFLQISNQEQFMHINVTCSNDAIKFKFLNSQTFDTDGHYPIVDCWFHIWAYAQALKKCNIYARHLEDFDMSEEWVMRPKSKQFRDIVPNIINYDLIHLPEHQQLPDGTLKEIHKIL